MKNLKRILALVLCLAMVMGLGISAGATSFTDDADISEANSTAVEVLTALGIINGYTDGSFQPTATVTRAEVAKMIAVAFNGGDESINDLYANVVCGLTDIGGTWAEGYIKYCYSTGIVDGYPDGSFLPDGEITGLELCQIMLNILGVDVDTSSTPWASAVMAKSSTVGLLKDVSTAAGSAITRQEAAQVIYNALDVEIQDKNLLGIEIGTGETILSKYLGGSVETIVIVGNEYASLVDDEPLDAGEIETEDGDILDWDTEAVEQSFYTIGLSYKVWIVKDAVIYAEDAGNVVEEYTAAGRPLAKQSDLDLDDAEYYVNFDDEAETVYTAEYRIEYWIQPSTAVETLVNNYGTDDEIDAYDEDSDYTNTIYADDELSDLDYQLIKYIFRYADDEGDWGDQGEIYVGTKSSSDYSDYYSFSEFVENVLEESEDVVSSVSLENGNYVAVIDNDKDGDAEYVLKIEYAMAVVVDIASNGTYTISTLDEDEEMIEIDDDDNPLVVLDDSELEEGDIIVYAPIDTVYYVNLAEVVEAVEVDDIDYSDEVLTDEDDTEYEQSGIAPDDDVNGDQTSFEQESDDSFIFYITDAEEGYEYDLYLDNYGYVRALTLTSATNGFGLLTDAYYYTNGRTPSAQVTMSTTEATKVDYDVDNPRDVSGSAVAEAYLKYIVDDATEAIQYFFNYGEGVFISTTAYDDNGTWGRLVKFAASDDDNDDDYEVAYKTNVVVYSGDEDGVTISEVGSSYIKEGIDPSTFTKLADTTLSTYDGTTVYPTSDTVYYYVDYSGDVTVWTGYANYSSDVTFENTEVAYTIAHQTHSTSGYYVADVIVIEDQTEDTSAQFIYQISSSSSKSTYWTTGIGIEDDEVDDEISTSGLKSSVALLDFYYYNAKTKTMVSVGDTSDEYAEYGIYAVVAEASYDVNYDYLPVSGYNEYSDSAVTFDLDDVPVYVVSYSKSSGEYSVSTTTKVYEGEQLIIVVDTESPKTILYAISVDKSVDKNADLTELWATINGDNDDYVSSRETLYSVVDDIYVDDENQTIVIDWADDDVDYSTLTGNGSAVKTTINDVVYGAYVYFYDDDGLVTHTKSSIGYSFQLDYVDIDESYIAEELHNSNGHAYDVVIYVHISQLDFVIDEDSYDNGITVISNTTGYTSYVATVYDVNNDYEESDDYNVSVNTSDDGDTWTVTVTNEDYSGVKIIWSNVYENNGVLYIQIDAQGYNSTSSSEETE